MQAMARDYRKEREQYYGYGPVSGVTPLQRKHRQDMAARKKARAKLCKKGKDCKGKEVDHKDGNPQNNKGSNLQVVSRHANRVKG
jgi:hypothetical protein